MFPFSSFKFSMLPLLYVGVLLSSVASPACINPPCKENLVASPIQLGTGVGAGTGACEGQTGTTACRTGVSLAAISDVPRKVEHKHELPQFQYKVTDILYSTFHCVCVCVFHSSQLKISEGPETTLKQSINSSSLGDLKVYLFTHCVVVRVSGILPNSCQQVLSHGTLDLAPPTSQGTITVSNQRRDKIRFALKISSSYGCAELMQEQVC